MKQPPITFMVECRFPRSTLSAISAESGNIIEDLKLDNDEYLGKVMVPVAEVPAFLKLVTEEGALLNMHQTQYKATNGHAKKANGHAKKAKTNGVDTDKYSREKSATRISELKKLLSKGYMTVPDMQTATAATSSAVHGRLASMRREGILKIKDGPGNKKLYTIKGGKKDEQAEA